jgi:hypothetical protein
MYKGPAAQASSKATQQIQQLISYVYHNSPTMSVLQTTSLHASPHKVYHVKTSDDSHFTLKTLPPRNGRLLRHEQESPAVQAQTLDLVNRSSGFTPRLIASSISHPNHPLSSDFLLTGFICGKELSNMGSDLTTFDREQIDRSVGAAMRAVTTSRSHAFGLPTQVLTGKGHATWTAAMKHLLELALRDAEDARLTIPYDSIRYYCNIHMSSMEYIVEARLTALRAGVPETVIVDESRKSVVGVVGWSEMIWGDPMLGAAFVSASHGFWSGFGGPQATGSPAEGAEVRKEMQALIPPKTIPSANSDSYTVYQSIISIIKCYYRARPSVDDIEDRRALNAALNRLAEFRT